MARSDEAQAFFDAVYAAIQEIPHGRVTTYGHIAALIGTRESSTPQIPRVYCRNLGIFVLLLATYQHPRESKRSVPAKWVFV